MSTTFFKRGTKMNTEEKSKGIKLNKTKIILIIAAALAVVLVAVFAIYSILQRQPDRVAKRMLREMMTYKYDECQFFGSEETGEQLAKAMTLSAEKLGRTSMTEDCRNQILASDLPRRLARLAYDSKSNIDVKKITIEPENAGDGEYTFGFAADIVAGDKKSQITGSLIMIQKESGWLCNYLAVMSFD